MARSGGAPPKEVGQTAQKHQRTRRGDRRCAALLDGVKFRDGIALQENDQTRSLSTRTGRRLIDSRHTSDFTVAPDLVRNLLRAGMSRGDVEQLLGTADFASADSRYVTYVLADRLAAGRLFNSIALLHLDFDDQGKLVESLIRFD